MMKVAIFVFPGVEELDFVGVYEVLAKAGSMIEDKIWNLANPIHVEIIGNQKQIVCANGMIIKVHSLYQGLEDYDLLIIPGGEGIKTFKKKNDFLEDLKQFSKNKKKRIASVCTGALILAWAGLLSGRRATTHHLHRTDLEKFCTVTPKRVVLDENIITAGGISASIDLGLKLLEVYYDKKVSKQVAERIEYRK